MRKDTEAYVLVLKLTMKTRYPWNMLMTGYQLNRSLRENLRTELML